MHGGADAAAVSPPCRRRRRSHDRPKCASASRPRQPAAPDFVNEWVSWGAGTRAAQFLVLGAKARALLAGRAHVTIDDLASLALPVLRHRILLNYRAEAEGVRVDEVIRRLVELARGGPGRA